MKFSKMLFLGLLLALISFVGCQDPPCIEYNFPYCGSCEGVYQPVCGCNDKTYSNPCEAECRGITNFTYGKCNINPKD